MISRLFLAVFALSVLITLCPDYINTQQNSNHHLFLQQLNAITFHPTTPHNQHEIISYAQLMKNLTDHDPLPKHVAILCNEKWYRAKEGVAISKSDHTVFIFSRGYEYTPCSARGSYLYTCHIVPDCPLVCFDYNDSRKNFSFGQQSDIERLEAVYQAVLKKNPNAHIVLIGNCNGAKVALELATKRPKNLCALILLSPIISAEKTIDHMAQSFHIPRRIMHAGFKRLCPQYDPTQDTLWSNIHLIDTRLPIFIGQRAGDIIIPDEEVRQLAQQLRACGNNAVHGVIVTDTRKWHDNIYLNEIIQQHINQFLKQYGLPYNPQYYGG